MQHCINHSSGYNVTMRESMDLLMNVWLDTMYHPGGSVIVDTIDPCQISCHSNLMYQWDVWIQCFIGYNVWSRCCQYSSYLKQDSNGSSTIGDASCEWIYRRRLPSLLWGMGNSRERDGCETLRLWHCKWTLFCSCFLGSLTVPTLYSIKKTEI